MKVELTPYQIKVLRRIANNPYRATVNHRDAVMIKTIVTKAVGQRKPQSVTGLVRAWAIDHDFPFVHIFNDKRKNGDRRVKLSAAGFFLTEKQERSLKRYLAKNGWQVKSIGKSLCYQSMLNSPGYYSGSVIVMSKK